jgi:hypothetical protein
MMTVKVWEALGHISEDQLSIDMFIADDVPEYETFDFLDINQQN